MTAYEFTESQNQQIDEIAGKLSHISMLFYAFGVLQLLEATLISAGAVVWGATASGLLFLGLGFVYQRPLDNFKKITTTEGSDIPELMIGLDDLHVAYLTGQVLIVCLSGVLLADAIRLLL
jgi:hypothetical protein